MGRLDPRGSQARKSLGLLGQVWSLRIRQQGRHTGWTRTTHLHQGQQQLLGLCQLRVWKIPSRSRLRLLFNSLSLMLRHVEDVAYLQYRAGRRFMNKKYTGSFPGGLGNHCGRGGIAS